MSGTALTRAEAIKLAATAVGVAPPDDNAQIAPDQLIAEYLRRLLTFLVHADGAPVHINRLTHSARRQLGPLFPAVAAHSKRPSEAVQRMEGDRQPNPIRRILESLSDLREVAHVGNGYWSPTPTRVITLPGRQLIISGFDTVTLRTLHTKQIELIWIARVIDASTGDRDRSLASLPSQSLNDWLGLPPADLSAWTKAQLTEGEGRLAMSSADIERFDVYAPAERASEAQAFRWIDADRLVRVPRHLVLCRGERQGARVHWLGELRRSGRGIVLRREAHVKWDAIRRLMYGMDQAAGAPVKAMVDTRNNDIRVLLRNPLPAEERRLLLALGREASQVPGRLPLIYVFSERLFPTVDDHLRRLGIAMQQWVGNRYE